MIEPILPQYFPVGVKLALIKFKKNKNKKIIILFYLSLNNNNKINMILFFKTKNIIFHLVDYHFHHY